jgi:anti-anti-sigma factor
LDSKVGPSTQEVAVAQGLVLEERRGRHLSLQYSSDAELGTIVAEFVRDGLRAAERVAYATDSDLATVTGRLAADQVGWEPALRSGALELITLADVEPGADGSRVTGVVARVQAFVETGLRDGFGALRIVSEAHAAAPAAETVEQMRTREALFDTLTATQPLTWLCLYDRRQFRPDVLTAAARAHDHSVADDLVYLDQMVTITRSSGRPGLRIVGEIDNLNAAALRQVLANMADESADGLTLEMSELRFIDVAGLRAIVDTATARPDITLRVQHANSVVTRQLSLCGWDRLPNLAVHPTRDDR